MLAVSSEEFSQRLHALLRQDRLALLIQLAEKWSQHQALPTRAALIEGEALLYLCQMDRAWTRFREVLEQDPENEDALILVIELFLRRGWPIRARKMIPRLRALNPRSPRIARLESRSAAPPIGPPRNANQVIQTASPSQLVAIAERFLCAGSQLKGQQLLELALRKDPQNMRARRLLWACQGDFSSQQKWQDLWEDALAEDVEDEAIIEPTVNMVMDSSEVRVDAFPALFRVEDGFEPEPDDEDEGESTRRMAFSEEFSFDSETEETRGFDGDTQVLDIVSQKSELTDAFEASLPEPQKMDLAIDNDDDVIVFTQIDESQVREPVHVPSGPIQVVEKRPTPVVPPSSHPQRSMPEPFKPLEPLKEHQKKSPPSNVDTSENNTVVKPTYGRYFIGLAIIVAIVSFGGLGLKKSAENRVDALVVDAIMSAEYMPLNQIAKQLEAQINSQNPPVDVRKAYLGLVHAFLWRDFTHAQADLDIAQAAMSTETEVEWIPKVIDAVIASGEKDWESVGSILPEDDNPVIAYLRLESDAMMRTAVADDVEQNARTAILTLQSVSREDELPEWVNAHQTLEFHLTYLERFWYQLSDSQKGHSFDTLKRYLHAEELKKGDIEIELEKQDKLSAIQYYRYEFLKSLMSSSNVFQTRRSVHRLDLNNPLFQMWVATDYLRQDQHQDAYNLFEKCARIHLDCLTGIVSIRITQDRLNDAHQALEQYTGLYSEENIKHLELWLKWAEGETVTVDENAPFWLLQWINQKGTELKFNQSIETPVQNYLSDIQKEAEQAVLNKDALMDSYLLWSTYQLQKDDSAKNAKRVLDVLRELSEKNLYSGRQWSQIITLYDILKYDSEDKKEALDFYLQLRPNGKNRERLKD